MNTLLRKRCIPEKKNPSQLALSVSKSGLEWGLSVGVEANRIFFCGCFLVDENASVS